MNHKPLLALAAAGMAALCLSACSHPAKQPTAVSAPISAPSPTPSAVMSTAYLPTPTPTAATPTPAAPPPTNAATPTPAGSQLTCAQMAKRTFIHITAVKSGTAGSLTITGNPATLVCGGMDDLHYNVATSTETGHVQPGASISVFPILKCPCQPTPISASKLASYLATDADTKIFMITGTLTAITGLQEEFHP